MKSFINSLVSTVKRWNDYQRFRVFFAELYPILKKIKVIKLLHTINKGSILDPYNHIKNVGTFVNRTYNVEDFNILESLDKYTIDFKSLTTSEKNYTIGFILNPNEYDLYNINESCKALDVKQVIFDIGNPDLYEELNNSCVDGILLIPSFENNIIRNAFHEAANILFSESCLKIYPTFRELSIYECKRSLANFLKINNIPHPKTKVFYDYERARNFIDVSDFPVVFKSNIGASSSGVEILKNKKQALSLARRLFFKKYLRRMETDKRSGEWGYMILQEYIHEVSEFRIIKAGDSWFCYQKWKSERQTFFSGSGMKKMINPLEVVLNFCYDLACKHNFTTMCFDVFMNKQGRLFVSELQTWFGSFDPSEMYVDNVPGRYYLKNGTWIFEPGFYNVYGSIALRLCHFMNLLSE